MAGVEQNAKWNAASQVTVTGTAGTLIAALPSRKGCTFRSLSTNTQSVWIGPATVTTTTGQELKPGEVMVFNPGEAPNNLLQAISTSGSQIIIVWDAQ